MSEIIKTTAEINTNKTMVEVKGGLVSKLPELNETEKDYAIYQIEKYIIDERFPKYLFLMRKEDNYFTILRNDNGWTPREFATLVFDFINTDEYFQEQGGIKLIEYNKDYVEVWIADEFYALFNAEGFIVGL